MFQNVAFFLIPNPILNLKIVFYSLEILSHFLVHAAFTGCRTIKTILVIPYFKLSFIFHPNGLLLVFIALYFFKVLFCVFIVYLHLIIIVGINILGVFLCYLLCMCCF